MNYKIYPRANTERNAKPKAGGGCCENCMHAHAQGANEICNAMADFSCSTNVEQVCALTD